MAAGTFTYHKDLPLWVSSCVLCQGFLSLVSNIISGLLKRNAGQLPDIAIRANCKDVLSKCMPIERIAHLTSSRHTLRR